MGLVNSGAVNGGDVVEVSAQEFEMIAAKTKETESVQVADAIDEAEASIRSAVPIARVIYLEPDIDRAGKVA